MTIVWRIRGKIIRTVMCCVMYNSCAQWYAHMWGVLKDGCWFRFCLIFVHLFRFSILWFSGVVRLFMVTLWNRVDHYIFILWFLSSFFFFPRLISAAAHWMSATWCGLSANLECMSEMCCTRLGENTLRKKSPFWHHRTTLLGCIFATEACIDNRKKTC